MAYVNEVVTTMGNTFVARYMWKVCLQLAAILLWLALVYQLFAPQRYDKIAHIFSQQFRRWKPKRKWHIKAAIIEGRHYFKNPTNIMGR